MILITPPRRPGRAGEWTRGAAIMFLVTLAATGTVTLAARAAGMSRKSAYALKKRDPFFAAAWHAAKRAAVSSPERRAEGDTRRRSAPSSPSTGNRGSKAMAPGHGDAAVWRDRLLAGLRSGGDSSLSNRMASLARLSPSQ